MNVYVFIPVNNSYIIDKNIEVPYISIEIIKIS